jgi:hypothetical protein
MREGNSVTPRNDTYILYPKLTIIAANSRSNSSGHMNNINHHPIVIVNHN